jgi:hypothetical protein
MGGLIAVVQQSVHRSFDALVVLGHSGLGLPEVLTEAELQLTIGAPDLLDIEDKIQELARTRFTMPSDVERRQPERGVFFADDVPEVVRRAFARQSLPLLYTCGLASMIPRSAGTQIASIDVPVFLGLGDQDLSADRYGAIGLYHSTPYATTYLLSESGHCHNQASSRVQLWERSLSWIEHVVDLREVQ